MFSDNQHLNLKIFLRLNISYMPSLTGLALFELDLCYRYVVPMGLAQFGFYWCYRYFVPNGAFIFQNLMIYCLIAFYDLQLI